MKITTAVIANDLHIPFEDPVAVNLFLGFTKRQKPDKIILLGDICDFYQISRFDKDPSRETDLQSDLDRTSAFLTNCQQIAPKAEIHYIQGNHESRIKKYLWSQAKALASLRSLSLTKLLDFDSIGIKYHEKGYQLGDLYCTHGSIIRKHAGYTARGEFEKNGCSGISGHSHRDSKYTVRNRGGHFVWYENYCLCDLNPEYVEGIANWTQGWSYVTIVNKRPYVEQIACIGGTYIYGGKLYGQKSI